MLVILNQKSKLWGEEHTQEGERASSRSRIKSPVLDV